MHKLDIKILDGHCKNSIQIVLKGQGSFLRFMAIPALKMGVILITTKAW